MAMPEYPLTIKLIAAWKIEDGEAITIFSDSLADISEMKEHRTGAEFYAKLSKYKRHRYLAMRKGFLPVGAGSVVGYFCTIEATSK